LYPDAADALGAAPVAGQVLGPGPGVALDVVGVALEVVGDALEVVGDALEAVGDALEAVGDAVFVMLGVGVAEMVPVTTWTVTGTEITPDAAPGWLTDVAVTAAA
jgi:hypothetical protein